MTEEERGVFECFHCLRRAVVWDSDASFEDVGEEGEGVVHFCHCAHCGAQIEYRVPVGCTEGEATHEGD